jgi:hypothetical protein
MATIIDPPSGWKYGFPKPIPEDRKKDVTVWLVEQGYPKEMIDSFGEHFYCRYWEQSEEDNKLDLKQLEDKLDEALAKETTESLTEWMDSKKKDDVWSLGLKEELDKLPYTKHLDDGQYNDGQLAGFEFGAEWAYNKAKETLYTEEQAREIWRAGQEYWKTSGASITFEELTEKLKQK